MHLILREISFGSEDYRSSVTLRKRVLRTPLGLDWEPGAFTGEDESFHLGAFSPDQKLIGCLILKPLDRIQLKMRQVAIEPDTQGQGIGSQLVTYSEDFARAKGYLRISAHARETALSFYRKHGYTISGPMFLEMTIPHFQISKSLV